MEYYYFDIVSTIQQLSRQANNLQENNILHINTIYLQAASDVNISTGEGNGRNDAVDHEVDLSF